ncbi:MAG: EAL domain-containing protein [Pseudomonadota bacterium]|nr:EAL domain-containing protein [Pseudomonadota bacterium]
MLALLLASPSAHAQMRSYSFHEVGAERGLLQGTTTALAEDAQGFIWVGTRGGLHRYDGTAYRALRHEPKHESIPENHITALAAEGNTLWIGFFASNVASLDTRSGKIRRYPAPPVADNHPIGMIKALVANPDQLWIARDGGVLSMNIAEGTTRQLIPRNAAGNGTLPQTLAIDHKRGRVLASIGKVLWLLDGSQAVRVGATRQPVLASTFDRASGVFWAVNNEGIFSLQDDQLALRWPLPITEPEQFNAARGIAVAPDGKVWITLPDHGLLHYDPRNHSSELVGPTPGIAHSLPETRNGPLLMESSGSMWVGGQFLGPSRFNPMGDRLGYVYAFGERDHRQSTASNSLRAVAQANDGAVWLSTDMSRLIRMDVSRPLVFREYTEALYTAFAAIDLPRESIRVLDMVNGGRDEIWLATNKGLGLIDTRTGHIRSVPIAGFGHPKLRALDASADGVLYIATVPNGIVRFDPARGQAEQLSPASDRSNLENKVHDVLLDRNGILWAGGDGGLLRIDTRSGRWQRIRQNGENGLSSAVVISLAESSAGQLLVGTLDGLDVLRSSAGGAITFDHPIDKRPNIEGSMTVFSIIEAPDNIFWLGTDTGLFRYEANAGQIQQLGMSEGLQDMEFNSRSTLLLRDGRVLMGGVRGANLFDPAAVLPATTPRLLITACRIGDRAWTLWPDATARGINLDHGERSLRVQVSQLDHASSLPAHYRFRLLPHETRWTDNGTLNEIVYSQLPIGEFVFEVQATDRHGNWSNETLRVPVSVAAPPWMSRTWQAIYAAAAITLLTALVAGWARHTRRKQAQDEARRAQDERLRLALWGAGESYWDYDIGSGTLTAIVYDLAGHEAPINTPVEIHPDDETGVFEILNHYLAHPDEVMVMPRHRVRFVGSNWRWVVSRGRAVKWDADQQPLLISGTVRDVGELIETEQAQRVASSVFQNMQEAVAVLDAEFRVLSVNPAFAAMTGRSESELLGQVLPRIADISEHNQTDEEVRRTLASTGQWAGELWKRHADGHDLLCHVRAARISRPIPGEGMSDNYVIVFNDITEQRKTELDLRWLANYDPLTHLPNRTLFNRRLNEALASHVDGDGFALLFLDLDRFKDINDSLGHNIGDDVLRAAAARIGSLLPAQSLVARLGGDEFIVLLEHVADQHAALHSAQTILSGFGHALTLENGLEFIISPSIGISLYPDDGHDAATLLRKADTAMYRAKAAGRQMYRRYEAGMDQPTMQRLQINNLLHGAIERGEISLLFQPRWSTRLMRFTGVEALLRWQHPELGLVPPQEFIPLAEESGHIIALGKWVAEHACKTLADWEAAGLHGLTMAINVSSVQLRQDGFAEMITEIVNRHALPPAQLELEITETVLMDNPALAAQRLRQIDATGIRMAIDDFGTGFSSLAYLRDLPISRLKIDRTFIRDITRNKRDEAIVVAIITMAHSMGLDTVAEGVENIEQLSLLAAEGCDEIQGYHVSRPLGADDCRKLLGSLPTPDTMTTHG